MKKMNRNYVSNSKRNKSEINYVFDDLFFDSKKTIASIKKEGIFSHWLESDFKLLEHFANFLKIRISDFNEIKEISPFMLMHIISRNWSSRSEKKPINFLKKLKDMIWEEDSNIQGVINNFQELLPNSFNSLESEFNLLYKYLNITLSNDKESSKKEGAFALPPEEMMNLFINSIKNKREIIIGEILEKFFSKSSAFILLSQSEKDLIFSTFLDLHLLFSNLKLFEIRFEIIQNLRGKKWNSEEIDLRYIFQLNKKEKNKHDIFLIPVKGYDYKKKVIFFGNEFIVKEIDFSYPNETLNDSSNLYPNESSKNNQWICLQGSDGLSEIISLLKIESNLQLSGYDYKRDVKVCYNYIDQLGIDEIEFTHDNTKRFNIIYLDDYIWAGATDELKKNNLIMPVLLKSRHGELVHFLRRGLDVIYSYQTNKSIEDVFLNAWFFFETASSNFSKAVTFNEKIKETLVSVSKISSIDFDDSIFDEMIIFRNSIVHGGNPTNIRVGTYNVVLILLIGLLIKHIMNKEFLVNALPENLNKILSLIKFGL